MTLAWRHGLWRRSRLDGSVMLGRSEAVELPAWFGLAGWVRCALAVLAAFCGLVMLAGRLVCGGCGG